MINDSLPFRRFEDEEDLSEILVKAKLLYDKLNIVALSLSLRFYGLISGVVASLLSIVALSSLMIIGSVPNIRYGDQFFAMEPLLLLISVVIGALVIRATYLLILERAYTTRIRNRLEHEIYEAQAVLTDELSPTSGV